MTDSPFLRSHVAAARFGVTSQMLAAWARRGWIARSVVGTATFYSCDEIDALIRRNRGDALPANVTAFAGALADAKARLGSSQAAAAAPSARDARQTKKRRAVCP